MNTPNKNSELAVDDLTNDLKTAYLLLKESYILNNIINREKNKFQHILEKKYGFQK